MRSIVCFVPDAHTCSCTAGAVLEAIYCEQVALCGKIRQKSVCVLTLGWWFIDHILKVEYEKFLLKAIYLKK